MLARVLFGLAVTWLTTPSIAADPAPNWPVAWQTNWTIYNVPHDTPAPPYVPVPLPPYQAGRGSTYYDFSMGSILEVYDDFCVPIFENGSNWRCHFLNTPYGETPVDTSFLITFEDHPDPHRPPCCVFAQPWFPPPPDFLNRVQAPFNQTTKYMSTVTDWWVYGGPPDGPFLYGFTRDSVAGWRVPGGFSFAAIQGWAAQHFHEWSPTKPSSSVFTVPDSCAQAKDCGFMPQARRGWHARKN